MMVGQVVTYEGREWVLAEMKNSAVTGPYGTPCEATVYVLAPLTAAGAASWVWVTVPNRRPFWWSKEKWTTVERPVPVG